jgi:hypothetical protein
MSNRNTGLESNNKLYTSAHIGGDTIKDKEANYVKDNLDILKEFNKKVPYSYDPQYSNMYTTTSGFLGGQIVQRYPNLGEQLKNDTKEYISDKSDRYEPYGDYLFKQGLINRDNITRYKTEYINIDSSSRTKIPSNLIEKSYNTNNNLTIQTNNLNKTEIKITIPNHAFGKNDKITLYGLTYTLKKLKLIVNSTILLQFTEGSEYLCINDKIPYVDNRVSNNFMINYDTSDMNIILDGVKGYTNSTYIGNIPITTLNKRHQIYLINPENPTLYNPDKYYIKLVKKFTGIYSPSSYNINITYLFIAGIPINLINADYPINFERSQGYHIIEKVDTNNIYININKRSFISNAINNFGGEITIEKIKTVQNGFPNPNNYIVNLGRNFSNVVSIRIVNSEFPNTEKNVRSFPESRRNNRLYWQNLDDGEYVYSIEIPSGNYTKTGLKTAIEKAISNIKRINTDTTNSSSFTTNNFMTVDINPETDIVTFNSYKVANLVKPFSDIDPEISLTGEDTVISTFYDITIEHPNHGAAVADIITINNAIDHYGIPASVLNTEHQIQQIIDTNRYQIRVSNFNLGSTRTNSGGGSAITITVPNIFRLRFDYPDTLGKLLGFRNVGDETSITQYNTSINNNESYLNEQLIDEAGRDIIISNNLVLLSGTSYILIVCKQLKGLYNQGNIKDAFAKVLMTGAYGTVQRDTYVNMIRYYHDPIVELGELEFEFYTPDGELYEFYDIDHSFVLEIVSLLELPKGTGITTNLGKIT